MSPNSGEQGVQRGHGGKGLGDGVSPKRCAEQEQRRVYQNLTGDCDVVEELERHAEHVVARAGPPRSGRTSWSELDRQLNRPG